MLSRGLQASDGHLPTRAVASPMASESCLWGRAPLKHRGGTALLSSEAGKGWPGAHP